MKRRRRLAGEGSRRRWRRKRRSGFADGRRVKKGGSARESERSIRTLATFFVVGTENVGKERERQRERKRQDGVYVCARVTQRGMTKEGDKARE